MGNYVLGGFVFLLGVGGIYFGVKQPSGDAWAPAWSYIFGGVIFAVIGLVFLAAELGWL